MSVEYFDALYGADPDPWDMEASPYERGKYVATVAALEGRRFRRGLEVGCSIGLLTAALAGVCDDLVAVDAAERAVAAARARLAGAPGVRVERTSVPDGTPAGPFDLIVCSEVLYYWEAPLLADVARDLSARLAPGGSLLAVHWRGPVRHYPQGGDDVHDMLPSVLPGLGVAYSRTTPRYRLDRLDRRA
jgi:SAM-dependent methyltransferase